MKESPIRLPVFAISALLLCCACQPAPAQRASPSSSENVQILAALRRAAAQGNVNAQFALGLDYDLGKGVQQDTSQAALWYQKAADQGLGDAQYNLGWLYDRALSKGPRKKLLAKPAMRPLRT